MNIQFWTNIVSPHQAAYIRELADAHTVTVIADQRIGAEREAQGWRTPDCRRARIVVQPDKALALDLLHVDQKTIHVVSGYRGCGMSSFVLREAAQGARIGLIFEGCDFRGARGGLGKARCRWDVRRNGARVDFALAMGSMGEMWWRSCGVATDSIYPFGYVAEQPAFVELGRSEAGSGVGLVYLGQMIHRKGVELLVGALAFCRGAAWHATLAGFGSLAASCRKLAAHAGIAERITFLPSQPHGDAMKVLAQADLLVLPSRYDGWGTVVNEALMRGVPVICTSACGASDLIRYPWLGSVIAPNSVESLQQALSEWIGRDPRTPELSERICTWSRSIEGHSMASYFVRVLECVYEGGPRPVAPWRIPCEQTGS